MPSLHEYVVPMLFFFSCQREKEQEEKAREEAQLMEFARVRQNLRKIHSAIQNKAVNFWNAIEDPKCILNSGLICVYSTSTAPNVKSNNMFYAKRQLVEMI